MTLGKTKTKTIRRKPISEASLADSKEVTSSAPGRPAGSKNIQRDEVDVVVSRCKGCNSTRRKPYGAPIVQLATGTDPTGKPFTHMIARPTACSDCGQARRDISYEYLPEKTADQVADVMDKKRRRKR